MSARVNQNDAPVSRAQPPPYDMVRELEATRKRHRQQQLTSLTTVLRLTIFSVYRQLFAIVCLANLAGVVFVTSRGIALSEPPLTNLITAAVANLTVAVIIRQDYVTNSLFAACWNVSHAAPLGLRCKLALVYENGGVHSGSAVGALLWTTAFLGFLVPQALHATWRSTFVLSCSIVLLLILVIVVLGALPQVRRRHHNLFENTHRIGGWVSVLLYWPTLLLFVQDHDGLSDADGRALLLSLLRTPTFWMLIVITMNIAYPWILLRKVDVVRVESLSDHAIRVYFSPRERIPALRGSTISDKPLCEWHSFAVIPDFDGCDGGANSCIISRAGDWTDKIIRDPPNFFYMRGLSKTGVLGMAKVFRSIVLMSTGSGIGPCLSILGQMPNTEMRVVWSAPDPVATFGKKICERVLNSDPRAIILNTRQPGQRRPDLVALAFEVYLEHKAEAVFFISNRKLTQKVVKGLKAKGVPIFAPIFDS
ncbi:hypothetical protein Q7P35_009818 [Cladosporium inversicolor]